MKKQPQPLEAGSIDSLTDNGKQPLKIAFSLGQLDKSARSGAPGKGNKTGGQNLIIGLSDAAKTWVVFVSLLLAAANIGFAWYRVNAASSDMTLTQAQIAAIANVAQQAAPSDPNLRSDILIHLADNQAQLKVLTNHQTLCLLAIGIGIALLAIGYALFLVGADGAFKLSARGHGGAQAMFYGTAPGLLCFLLAAVLIGVGITRHTQLVTGAFLAEGASASGNKAQHPKTMPYHQKAQTRGVLMGAGANRKTGTSGQ